MAYKVCDDSALAVEEMTEPESVHAANYTAQHYFSVDARTFLAKLRAGSISSDDYRVSRVLSMILPIQALLEAS